MTGAQRQIAAGSFDGQTVLVTGGTSGIGREAAKGFAAAGATVVLTGRELERGEQVLGEVESAGGNGRFVEADLAEPGGVAAVVEQCGDVDVLVNNAGIFPFGLTSEIDEATFDATFALNVKAPFQLVAALTPGMIERGSGVILNVTSGVGRHGMAVGASYGASKAALELLTKAWAADYGPQGIRVNAVSPGPTRTPGIVDTYGDMLDAAAAQLPLGRPAEPGEIANVIVYLATSDASFVHGAIVQVDGGQFL